MPKAPVPAEVSAFLHKPNEAVIATVRKDGAPFTAVNWYDWDGRRIFVNMDAARVRLGHMRRDPRVAVTVIDQDNWYWQVSLLGRVVTIEDDADFSGSDRLAQRYIGQDYPDKSRPRVNVWIEVDSWNGWDPVNYTTWQAGVAQPPV